MNLKITKCFSCLLIGKDSSSQRKSYHQLTVVYMVCVFWSESGGWSLGAGAVQAASAGCWAGARGWDAAPAAGAGAVQCLRGDDPPPGAGERTPARAPGVCHPHLAFPWHAPHSRYPGSPDCLPHSPAESRGPVQHKPPIQSPSSNHRHTCHRPAKLRPVAQAWVSGQPREQQWVHVFLTQGADPQRI